VEVEYQEVASVIEKAWVLTVVDYAHAVAVSSVGEVVASGELRGSWAMAIV
jgi:hypothetical protein